MNDKNGLKLLEDNWTKVHGPKDSHMTRDEFFGYIREKNYILTTKFREESNASNNAGSDQGDRLKTLNEDGGQTGILYRRPNQ